MASLFTEDLKGRHRCLVAHPVNPPHLVPLVELVGAPWTAPATIDKAKAIYAAVGGLIVVVALLATSLPAFRATRADPNTALRSD